MLDGKTLKVITGTSSYQTCPVCKEKPSEMNKIDKIQAKIIDSEAFSPLHAYIRCLLHIAYRRKVRSWQIRKEHKEICDKEKTRIQDEMRLKYGLVVDMPIVWQH